ncbi:tannase and feruloyl esterase [Schizopora paradoxa]|uniref:Carboxylic ester hydrolase n=1 Tax=Schizopora paradoxa TaxID=27342 RepID=A0A0H2S0C8_9AGAM|nr:tannase and feruloyl esterase [Schizopora paradoxa]
MESFAEVFRSALLQLQKHALHYLLGATAIFHTPSPLNIEPSHLARESNCLALRDRYDFVNTTVLGAIYYARPVESVPTLGICLPTAKIQTPLCRVQFTIETSETSVVTAEMWLPDTWHGRFLALGNGGLAGCINYKDLEYGTSMHFATVASNNGHDGDTSIFFIDNPEVHIDFAHRSIHVEAEVGKQIVEAYYGTPHNKAYYLGCSTGGRQGVDAALRYPEDFDGILAGAPATDYINILGHVGMLNRFLGGPNASRPDNPLFISSEQWDSIAQEVFRQCDDLDGVMDGIITEPDDCHFRPEALVCEDDARCLTSTQVEVFRKIYSPLYGTKGQLLASRFDPGAEGTADLRAVLFSDRIYDYVTDYWKHVIYNDTNRDLSHFDLTDVEFAGSVNPAGVATNGGDMSKFKSAGGKLVLYHGRRDAVISSGNTKRLYDRVSRSLGLASLDPFLRLFLVPGMDHCGEGPGASNFGQHGLAKVFVNDTAHDILLALVDWVENDNINAPNSIIGINPESGKERKHCRYPHRSVFNGRSFECV